MSWKPGDKARWDGEVYEVWAVSPTGYAWLADSGDGYVVMASDLSPLPEPVYVECFDPEVLHEWENERGDGAVQCEAGGVWRDRSGITGQPTATLADWRTWLASDWRYRLVFSSAEEAAEHLDRWTEQGRVVEAFGSNCQWYRWQRHMGEAREVQAELAGGALFRIDAAPATERIPWAEAFGRTLPDGGRIGAVGLNGEHPNGWVVAGTTFPALSADDNGTVEVLVGDDQ